ncbi:MAG TPA: DEAD/DEAH box helicase [Parafilimonas sp.]|nr:DEAD/DEAH box helicase [Parafilimonas sp.]
MIKIFDELIKNPSEVEEHNFIPLLLAKSVLIKFRSNNLWSDLLPFGTEEIWRNFVRFNLKKFPSVWSFFPSQREAINKGLFNFENSFSLQTPTSSGKTTIAELIIYNEFVKDPTTKILYLAPFRALATELRYNLRLNLSRFGIKIKAIYGGNSVSDIEKNSFETASVLISTPEKFLAVENILSEILDQYKVVICDEGHLIDNKSRGVNYELLLSRLKNNKGIKRKFLFLSAIIPNIEIIQDWLGGQKDQIAYSDYRPTQLELAFMSSDGVYDHNLTVNPFDQLPKRYILNKVLYKDDFRRLDGSFLKPTSFTRKAIAISLKALNAGVVALFVPTKGGTSGILAYSANVLKQLDINLPLPKNFCNEETITTLKEYFSIVFGRDYLLTRCINEGFVYHHGDLPQFIRELLEYYIRNNQIRFFLCTTTLAEGVNLPIKTLVISSARRFNPETETLEPLTGRDLKNLIGRAGRAGKETKGMIIVANPGDFNIINNVFTNQSIENVQGYLFHVVQAIQKFIKKESLQLSNDLLESLDESEIIDNSIIQLLAEDIDVQTLDENISTLVNQTLTYFQANDETKNLLRAIFNLRSQRLRQYVENKKIAQLKYTGVSIKNFELFENIVDFNQEYLGTITSPIDDNWLKYIIDIIYQIPTLKILHDDKDVNYISKEKLTSFIKAWCTGAWYNDISKILEVSVDSTLSFFNDFISLQFQVTVAGVIRYIELKRLELELPTSKFVSGWANFLLQGFSNKIQLDLFEISATDRIGVFIIAQWINDSNFEYDSINDLRNLISQNRNTITDLLIQGSRISQQKFYEFLQRYDTV